MCQPDLFSRILNLRLWRHWPYLACAAILFLIVGQVHSSGAWYRVRSGDTISHIAQNIEFLKSQSLMPTGFVMTDDSISTKKYLSLMPILF